MKIPKDRIKATELVAVMDDAFNDPRTHGIRIVYLRWVEIEPKSRYILNREDGRLTSLSEELKSIISVPVSKLSALADRTIQVRCSRTMSFTDIILVV